MIVRQSSFKDVCHEQKHCHSWQPIISVCVKEHVMYTILTISLRINYTQYFISYEVLSLEPHKMKKTALHSNSNRLHNLNRTENNSNLKLKKARKVLISTFLKLIIWISLPYYSQFHHLIYWWLSLLFWQNAWQKQCNKGRNSVHLQFKKVYNM